MGKDKDYSQPVDNTDRDGSSFPSFEMENVVAQKDRDGGPCDCVKCNGEPIEFFGVLYSTLDSQIPPPPMHIKKNLGCEAASGQRSY